MIIRIGHKDQKRSFNYGTTRRTLSSRWWNIIVLYGYIWIMGSKKDIDLLAQFYIDRIKPSWKNLSEHAQGMYDTPEEAFDILSKSFSYDYYLSYKDRTINYFFLKFVYTVHV